MSYQGVLDYRTPIDTVDESADYTEMMGQASLMNQANQPSSLRTNPTKALIALWVGVVVVYWFLAFFFRRYNV